MTEFLHHKDVNMDTGEVAEAVVVVMLHVMVRVFVEEEVTLAEGEGEVRMLVGGGEEDRDAGEEKS